jgi:hypothetical protein
MNTASAKEKLEAFIGAYVDWSDAHVGNSHDLYRDAIRRTHTVVRIIEILGLEAPVASDADDELFLPRLGHVATTALGLLDDWDELDKNLRPTAPAIAADQLHPWVWDAARTFWDSKHYRAAVHQAALSINMHLQDKVDRRDISDYRLIGTNQKASTKAVFDDLYDRRTEIAERLGFELGWERLDNRASRIACYYDGQLDPLTADTATLDAAARWSAARIQALHSTLDQELWSLATQVSSLPAEQA